MWYAVGMTTHHENIYHQRQAQLARLGEHWQKALWDGDPDVGWDGDRFLVIYHHVLTDDILIKHELPDGEPVLVMRVPMAEFDIKLACRRLAQADNRKRSVASVFDEVDAHNARLVAEDDKRKQELLDAATEKLHWALRKDTGQHIAPLHVTKNPARIA